MGRKFRFFGVGTITVQTLFWGRNCSVPQFFYVRLEGITVISKIQGLQNWALRAKGVRFPKIFRILEKFVDKNAMKI